AAARRNTGICAPCPRKRKLLGHMNESEPPVSPSASPRNSENDPSVTISGGMRSPVINAAFSNPARPPAASVRSAAIPTGIPASRNILPNSTAERAMRDPTERSMPPVTMTGVIASASNPTSTLTRIRLKAFPGDRKFFPITQKTAISRARSNPRIRSCDATIRSQGPRSVCCKAGANIPSLPQIKRIGCNRDKNYRTLDGLFPRCLDIQKHERRADHSQQNEADKGSDQGPPAPRDRGSADDDCRDRLECKALARRRIPLSR